MEELKKTFAGYEEFKQTLDTELTRTTEGFVRIGFLLKTARDNPDILAGSGYAGINDMAAAEYNIDKTMVSRFISINDRFSEGGNSDRLQDKYRGYGYAKLAIMLQLPGGINDEISPAYSKSEINTIKKEYDEEQQVTPLEVMTEPKDATVSNAELTVTEKVIYVLMHNEPELFRKMYSCIPDWKKYREILAPAGEAVYIARISGIGKFMISVKSEGIAVVNMRDTSERQQISEDKFMELCGKLFGHDEPTAEAKWKALFMENMPGVQGAEVAPVQQEKKPVVKKPKVTVTKREKSQKKEPDKQAAQNEEEQLKGQMNVGDYPGVVPENNKNDTDAADTVPDEQQKKQCIPYRPIREAWHSAKDSVPDDDRYILISVASRAVPVIGIYDEMHEAFFKDDTKIHYAEAWMELPEPYEKERGGTIACTQSTDG